MCRHIYDWNTVDCDVKQPIHLTLVTCVHLSVMPWPCEHDRLLETKSASSSNLAVMLTMPRGQTLSIIHVEVKVIGLFWGAQWCYASYCLICMLLVFHSLCPALAKYFKMQYLKCRWLLVIQSKGLPQFTDITCWGVQKPIELSFLVQYKDPINNNKGYSCISGTESSSVVYS